MFLLLIYVVTMTNQKKIIKISNGNECIGSGHPVGGGGGTRSRLSSMADRQEGRHIFILYL